MRRVNLWCGRDPPPCVLQKLGAELFVIENFVNKCHDTFKSTLRNFAEQRPPSRGVIWHGGCVHEFLNTHAIVAADKDGDQVVMSLKTYVMEQNNNMGVVHKSGDPVCRKLQDFTTDHELIWTNQAKVWRRDVAITAITLLEFQNVDEPLTESLQNLFERSPPLKMPNFLHASENSQEKINSPTDHSAHKLVHNPPINHFEHIGKTFFALRCLARRQEHSPDGYTGFCTAHKQFQTLGGQGPHSVCPDLPCFHSPVHKFCVQ